MLRVLEIMQSSPRILMWLLAAIAIVAFVYFCAQMMYLFLEKAQNLQRQQLVDQRLKSGELNRAATAASDARVGVTTVGDSDIVVSARTLPLLSKSLQLKTYCRCFKQGRALLDLLNRAGLDSRAEALLQYWFVLVGFLALFAFVWSSFMLSCIFVLLAVGGSFAYLQGRVDKRKQALRASIPDMLDELAQSLRAGRSFPQSINYVLNAQSPDSVLLDMLRRLDADARLGRSCAESLKELSLVSGLRELKSVAAVLEISLRVGGSIPSLFEQIATSIRQDLMLNNKLKMQTAQGRSSVRLVGSVPFLLIGLMSLVMPGYLRLWLSTFGGQMLFGLAMFLVAIGFYWVRTVVNIRV